MNSGNITWMNGLVMGMAKVRGMKGAFISGEMLGQLADVRAAQAILNVLERMFGIRLSKKLPEQLQKLPEEKTQVALTDEARADQTRYIS